MRNSGRTRRPDRSLPRRQLWPRTPGAVRRQVLRFAPMPAGEGTQVGQATREAVRAASDADTSKSAKWQPIINLNEELTAIHEEILFNLSTELGVSCAPTAPSRQQALWGPSRTTAATIAQAPQHRSDAPGVWPCHDRLQPLPQEQARQYQGGERKRERRQHDTCPCCRQGAEFTLAKACHPFVSPLLDRRFCSISRIPRISACRRGRRHR